MEAQETMRKLTAYVQKIWDQEFTYYYNIFGIENEDIPHVIECCASILSTKYPELGGYQGGSFAQAVANNDLMGAFGAADHVNTLAMKFHAVVLYNFSPRFLDEID